MKSDSYTRRKFIGDARNLTLLTGLTQLLPSYAWGEITKKSQAQVATGTVDLIIERTPFVVNGKSGSAVTVNGRSPEVRFPSTTTTIRAEPIRNRRTSPLMFRVQRRCRRRRRRRRGCGCFG